MTPPHAARQESVFVGDARSIPLPNGSVQCVVTSPPYYGLRDYGVDGQIGSEGSLDEFLGTMVDVMREVRRVLRDDGTVWLNMGDSFASPTKGSGGKSAKQGRNSGSYHKPFKTDMAGFRAKCKMLVPHRLAIALCDDGWILRQDIVWAKPNPMPESTRDRPTTAHEFLFLLAKNPRYYYDAEAIREPLQGPPMSHFRSPTYMDQDAAGSNDTVGPRQADAIAYHTTDTDYAARGRNKRSVWTIPSHPFPDAHFATFPPTLVEPCIKAGTAQQVCPTCSTQWVREIERGASTRRGGVGEATDSRYFPSGGAYHGRLGEREVTTTGWFPACDCPDNDGSGKALVLDPFCGSGTTGVVARQMGRAFFGVELNPEYAEMARRRIAVEGEGRARSEQADGSVHEQQVLAI